MQLLTIFCSIIITVSASAFDSRNFYSNYKVYRIKPLINRNQESIIKNLADDNQFDIWTPLARNASSLDIMVPPFAIRKFLTLINAEKIQYDVLIEDVGEVIDAENTERTNVTPLKPGDISFDKYNRFGEVSAYIDRLVKDHSEIAAIETIGQSYEGRNLDVIKISTDHNAEKPIIFIDAGIHAREWIAPAQSQYIIHQLVENSSNSYLFDKVDWHILPIFNVDGYELSHSHSSYRLWRKTVSKQRGECNGTDANRNFDYHFGEIGTSKNPCSQVFEGPKAFSEKETQSVRDYMLKYQKRIKLYLTFHSYGNYLLYPWGYNSKLCENDKELNNLARDVNKAMVNAGSRKYAIGTAANVLYPAAGGSDDWAKGVAGIELVYTIELPGGGKRGFDPPADKILPTVRETFEGIKVYGNYITKKFGTK